MYYSGTWEQWEKIEMDSSDYYELTRVLVYESDTERPICLNGTCGENLNFVLYEDGELVISGTGSMDSHPWDHKKSEWITSITICEGVTSICDEAFYCSEGKYRNIKSVTIPDSVTTIGECAFCGCTGLTSVTISENSNLTTIGEWAFENCTGLTSITIPDSVTTIGDKAFSDCDGLTSVTISENSNLTTIGECAFHGCTGLTTVTIPDSVESIGHAAFSDCTALKELYVPASVKYAEYCFNGCSSLEKVIITKGTGIMPDYYNSYSYSPWYADNCSTVIIEDGVTNIGSYAFYGCTALTNITIPSSVINVGYDAFNCDNLNNVYYTGNIADWCETDFAYDAYNYANPITVADNIYIDGADIKQLNELVIPYGTTRIGMCAFPNCDNFKSVTIPNSVENIGSGAFHDCDGLTSIAFPESVATFGDDSLNECDNITSITISNSKAEVPQSLFYSCNGSLEYVKVPFKTQHLNLSLTTPPANITIADDFLIAECSSEKFTSTVTIGSDITGIENNRTVVNLLEVAAVDKIILDSENTAYKLIDGVLYDSVVETLVLYPNASDAETYIMPDTVTQLSDMYYSWGLSAPNVRKVTIGKSFLNCDMFYEEYYDTLLECDENLGYLFAGSLIIGFMMTAEEFAVADGNELLSVEDGYLVLTLEGKKFLLRVADNDAAKQTVISEGEYLTIGSFLGGRNLDITFTDEWINYTYANYDYENVGCSFEELINIILTCACASSFTVSEENEYLSTSNGALLNKAQTTLIKYPVDSNANFWSFPTTVSNVALTSDAAIFGSIGLFDGTFGKSFGYIFPENLKVHCSNNIILAGYAAIEYCIDPSFATQEDIDEVNQYFNETYCNFKEDYDEYLAAFEEVDNWYIYTPEMYEFGLIESMTLKEAKATLCDGNHHVHTPGEWEIITEATVEHSGYKVQKCTECKQVIASENIPMLQRIRNDESKITADIPGDMYNGNYVELFVEEAEDDAAFEFISNARHFAYDIKILVNGVETQPTGKVTVRVPIGVFSFGKYTVYHIDPVTHEREELPCERDGKYIVFETDSFSYFVIADATEYEISIKQPSVTTINYGETLVLHADLGETGLPEGYAILWTVEGSGVTIQPSEDGLTCNVTSVQNGNVTVKATVVDENGEAILDADGNEISAEQQLTSKAGFWQKFISFFKNLFRISRIILQYK